MKLKFNPFLPAATAVCIALSSQFVQGATATKQNNGTNDLSSTASGVWSGGSGTNSSPTTADVATWAAASSTGAHTVGSAANWGSMSLSGNTAAVSISGSQITLASGGAGTTTILSNSSQSLTIDNNVVATAVNNSGGTGIGSTTNRIQLNAAAATTLNGSVTATGGANANDVNLFIRGASTGTIGGTLTVDGQLYKGDAGTWTLNSANTIGWLAINNGTLLGGNNSAFGAGTIYLSSGGGDMTLASSNSTARAFGNKVDFSTLTFTGTASFGQTSGGTGALTFGELALGTAVRNLAVNANTSFSSVSGTTGGITKTGAGTLTLSGANSISGTTTVTHSGDTAAGITLASASALGTSAVLVNGGQNFQPSVKVNDSLTVGNALTLKRGSSGSFRAILGLGSSSAWSGNITVDNTSGSGLAVILCGGTSAASASVVSGNIGYSTLGTGTSLVLRGGSSYGNVTGSASLSNGTVQLLDSTNWEFSNASNTWGKLDISNSGAIAYVGAVNTLSSSGVVSSTAGGTLRLNNMAGTTAYSQTIAGLSGTNLKVGLATGSAALTLNTTADQSASVVISGAISLVKSGSAKQTLTAANTYTGTTTIKAGTLKLDTAGSIDNSTGIVVGDTGSSGAVLDVTTKTTDFTVDSTQTLSGIGTVNAAGKKVIMNGAVAPGNSAGLLSVSNSSATDGFAFGSTGALNIEMTKGVTPSASSNYDQLGLTGGLTIDVNASLNLSALGSGAWNLNDIFFLITNDGADAITGTFSGFGEGATITFDSQEFKATYQADSVGNSFTGGNDFALQVIPEPSAILLGGIGVLGLALRRRRV